MKPESLVIVDQHATVNTYLSLVLPARHTLGVVCSGSVFDIFIFYIYFEKYIIYVNIGIRPQTAYHNWSEVVTR
jgi:hypothetical protein